MEVLTPRTSVEGVSGISLLSTIIRSNLSTKVILKNLGVFGRISPNTVVGLHDILKISLKVRSCKLQNFLSRLCYLWIKRLLFNVLWVTSNDKMVNSRLASCCMSLIKNSSKLWPFEKRFLITFSGRCCQTTVCKFDSSRLRKSCVLKLFLGC